MRVFSKNDSHEGCQVLLFSLQHVSIVFCGHNAPCHTMAFFHRDFAYNTDLWMAKVSSEAYKRKVLVKSIRKCRN